MVLSTAHEFGLAKARQRKALIQTEYSVGVQSGIKSSGASDCTVAHSDQQSRDNQQHRRPPRRVYKVKAMRQHQQSGQTNTNHSRTRDRDRDLLRIAARRQRVEAASQR
jgi:hypothetical protein